MVKSKKYHKEPLKLVQWRKDGCPPINLNNEVTAVLNLVAELLRLRERLAKLEKEYNKMKKQQYLEGGNS